VTGVPVDSAAVGGAVGLGDGLSTLSTMKGDGDGVGAEVS
jgi:hypothetical protein